MKLKRLLPLVLLALFVSFSGCKKGPDKLIAKTWKVTDVVAKGYIEDSIFQVQKSVLLNVEMTFQDNKYTMSSVGTVIESGTYSVDEGRVVVKTEKNMNMDAFVTKDKLTLETPDFTISLVPK
jgi:hypothetical protein